MTNYNKGANAERELLRLFYDNGFAVMRAAGSGVNALGPDIIAALDKKVMAFECKAWDSTSLSISDEQFRKLGEWLERSGCMCWISWKVSRDGWYFVKLSEMRKTEKNWVITAAEVEGINRRFEDIIAMFRPMPATMVYSTQFISEPTDSFVYHTAI